MAPSIVVLPALVFTATVVSAQITAPTRQCPETRVMSPQFNGS